MDVPVAPADGGDRLLGRDRLKVAVDDREARVPELVLDESYAPRRRDVSFVDVSLVFGAGDPNWAGLAGFLWMEMGLRYGVRAGGP